MNMRNNKKLTRAAIAMAAVASVTAKAEIELTEGLSLQGFLDLSAQRADDGKDTESTAEVGEFEVDLLYGGDSVNAQVDLNYIGRGGNDEGVELEQAFVGYSVSDQFSLKAGKFLSCIGYESFDVNGLNQYSWAASTVYPGHHTGLAGVYSGETFGVYASAVADTWDPSGTDLDNLGYEVQVFTSPAEGLTVKLGYATGDVDSDAGSRDKSILNLWAAYSVDDLTVAAEYSSLEDFGANGSDGDAYMLMGNYAFTDTFNATLRYAHVDADWAEIDEFTISPRFVISDNVSVITEYRNRDFAGGGDEDLLAARVLYTF